MVKSSPALLLILALIVTTSLASAITYEKKPGALNPSVDPGDIYNFACRPVERGVYINTRGVISQRKGRVRSILGKLPSDAKAGFLSTYLECYVMDDDTVLAAYSASNGEDSGVSVRRCAYRAKSCVWSIELLSPDLAPPSLKDGVLTVSAQGVTLGISAQDGSIKSAQGPGCLFIQRRGKSPKPTKDWLGDGCKDKKKSLK